MLIFIISAYIVIGMICSTLFIYFCEGEGKKEERESWKEYSQYNQDRLSFTMVIGVFWPMFLFAFIFCLLFCLIPQIIIEQINKRKL